MSDKTKIIVKSIPKLQDWDVYKRVHARNLKIKVSRRKVPLEIHKTIYGFKGKIVWPDGSPFKKPICIHTAFDLENRWYSNYRKVTPEGEPLMRSPVYHRIHLLDIWAQIRDLDGLDDDLDD